MRLLCWKDTVLYEGNSAEGPGAWAHGLHCRLSTIDRRPFRTDSFLFCSLLYAHWILLCWAMLDWTGLGWIGLQAHAPTSRTFYTLKLQQFVVLEIDGGRGSCTGCGCRKEVETRNLEAG